MYCKEALACKQDDKYIKNIKDIDMNKSLNIELSDGTVELKLYK